MLLMVRHLHFKGCTVMLNGQDVCLLEGAHLHCHFMNPDDYERNAFYAIVILKVTPLTEQAPDMAYRLSP